MPYKDVVFSAPISSMDGNFKVLRGLYDIPGLEFDKPPTILDIGANLGAFSLWARTRWPGANVVAYEPHPLNFRMAVKNTLGPGEGSLDWREAAVVDRPTGDTVVLYDGAHNCGESSIHDIGEQTKVGHDVGVINPRDLDPCDILKADTEGCELEILENYPHLSGVRAVMYEWHRTSDREAIANLLESAGFVCLSDEQWGKERGEAKWMRAPVPEAAVRPILFVATLVGGGKLDANHAGCIEGLRTACAANGVGLIVSRDGGTGVDRARNRQVAKFLAIPRSTHFMQVDNDIVFDPLDIVRMIRTKLPVVAGLYPRKDIDWENVEAAVKQGVPADKLSGYATALITNGLHVDGREYENGIGTFVEAEEVGTGFLMITRAALEKYIAAYRSEIEYETDYPPRGETHHIVFQCERDPHCERERAGRALLRAAAGDEAGSSSGYVTNLEQATADYQRIVHDPKSIGRYLTEDYSFCRRWRMLGEKLYVGLDINLTHIGGHHYRGNFRDLMTLTRLDTTEVSPGLLIGGYPPEGESLSKAGIDVLIQCASEKETQNHPGVAVAYLGLFDDPSAPPSPDVMRAVNEAARVAASNVMDGKKVLITCGQGLNRAALVAGHALWILHGWGGEKIVSHLRAARGEKFGRHALFNERFAAVVGALPPDAGARLASMTNGAEHAADKAP